jgi:hypothetical protein
MIDKNNLGQWEKQDLLIKLKNGCYVSSLKTIRFENKLGTFSYKKIKPNLMFGYNAMENNGLAFYMASPKIFWRMHDFLETDLQLFSARFEKNASYKEKHAERIFAVYDFGFVEVCGS